VDIAHIMLVDLFWHLMLRHLWLWFSRPLVVGIEALTPLLRQGTELVVTDRPLFARTHVIEALQGLGVGYLDLQLIKATVELNEA